MIEWAKEMKIDFEIISDYFKKKWQAKCDYEAKKSNNPESDNQRSRGLQKFDPDVVFDAYVDLEDDDDFTIEEENAEDDQ